MKKLIKYVLPYGFYKIYSLLRNHFMTVKDTENQPLITAGGWWDCYTSKNDFDKDTRLIEMQPVINYINNTIINTHQTFSISAYCDVCGKVTNMVFPWSLASKYGIPWHEQLLCISCEMNNRQRAMFELVKHNYKNSWNKIYLTEAITPSFNAYKEHYGVQKIVGSEFLGDSKEGGEYYNFNGQKIMHQDMTKLSFGDNLFDAIISQGVLEHVYKYVDALRECNRVLKQGGILFIMVPFSYKIEKTEVLAEVLADGTIEHHLIPPEIHGNPLDAEGGALAFYHYSWEFLEKLKDCDFSDVKVHYYHDIYKGYYGNTNFLITAQK